MTEKMKRLLGLFIVATTIVVDGSNTGPLLTNGWMPIPHSQLVQLPSKYLEEQQERIRQEQLLATQQQQQQEEEQLHLREEDEVQSVAQDRLTIVDESENEHEEQLFQSDNLFHIKAEIKEEQQKNEEKAPLIVYPQGTFANEPQPQQPSPRPVPLPQHPRPAPPPPQYPPPPPPPPQLSQPQPQPQRPPQPRPPPQRRPPPPPRPPQTRYPPPHLRRRRPLPPPPQQQQHQQQQPIPSQQQQQPPALARNNDAIPQQQRPPLPPPHRGPPHPLPPRPEGSRPPPPPPPPPHGPRPRPRPPPKQNEGLLGTIGSTINKLKCSAHDFAADSRLNDRAYVEKQIACVLNEPGAVCDDIGKSLKRFGPDIMRNHCPRPCDDCVKKQIQKVMAFMSQNYPAEWGRMIRQFTGRRR